ncbi:MAG: hypothetical protein Q8M02_14470 [Candidatus Didemnitutus sp.]|nr:hypothetical protein [Candidatus Didemnitutus sp.]
MSKITRSFHPAKRTGPCGCFPCRCRRHGAPCRCAVHNAAMALVLWDFARIHRAISSTRLRRTS